MVLMEVFDVCRAYPDAQPIVAATLDAGVPQVRKVCR
jgi:hypothetical protein